MNPKELEALRTRCALAGVRLHVTTDDRGQPMFVASRWSLSRTFASAQEVGQWLDRVVGAKGAVA